MKLRLQKLFGIYGVPITIAVFVACSAMQLPPAETPVDWPVSAKCGPDAGELVGTVSRILLDDGPSDQQTLSERGKAELEQLAREHGADTVVCLVDHWLQQWTSPGASTSPERTGATARAESFLQRTGTQIERAPSQ